MKDFVDYVISFHQAGGWIMPFITLTSLVLWLLGAMQFLSLQNLERKTTSRIGEGDSWKEIKWREIPDLLSNGRTIAVLVGAAPLMGLLGTVNGMMQTFATISTFGIGNPHFTAKGISVALLTTEWGLIVAFVGLMMHNFLEEKQRNLVAQWESEAVHAR